MNKEEIMSGVVQEQSLMWVVKEDWYVFFGRKRMWKTQSLLDETWAKLDSGFF